MLTQDAAIAANRFGLGARPRDAAAIGTDPKAWLEGQITAAKRATPKQAGTPESAQVLAKLRDLQAVRQAAAQARANAGQPKKSSTASATDANGTAAPTSASPGIDAIREFAQFSRDHYLSQVNDRNRRAIETDQPFVERLVQFWSNHFAISADKALVGPIAGLYEEEAIRPHVIG